MVVCAGVARDTNLLLIAKRKPDKSNGGLWEFPGGKLETNETDQHCLVREFLEEFSVHISVGVYLGTFLHTTDSVSIELRVYEVILKSEIKTLVDHSETAWIRVDQLCNYRFSPADVPVVEYILKRAR